MKRIKILSTVVTSQYGTLTDGDFLNCGDELAKHLVDECKCATYENKGQAAQEPATKSSAKPKSQKDKKSAETN